jgi:alpha-L-fucosidase
MTQPLSRRTFIIGTAGLAAAAAGAAWEPGSAEAAAPYTASWPSVDTHPPAPEWFQDAKFGIYFHWGVFSVPAYGDEWYPRRMYISGDACNTHHVATYGQPSAWPYHNFINGANDLNGNYTKFAPKLKSAGGNFDPNEWAQLFVDAGARFAGPVAEHHDGFSMWNSQVNEWNSVAKGPQLDLLNLFGTAIRAKNLKLLVAMHHAYHFNGYYDHVPAQSDPSLQKLYGQLGTTAENQLWYDKLKEVIDRAQPDILWEDFDLNLVDETQRLNFLSYYYNQAGAWGKEVVATYKDGFDNKGEVFDYERGGPADLTTPYWLTDDSISSSSWCYTVGIGYYSTQQMLHSLIDRVSKNGNMLLNIAPMADGTIPQGQKDILLGMGDYLGRFGESIYSTRAWTAYGEGPTQMGGGSFTTPRAGTAQDIRFTRDKTNTVLYATVLGWPGSTLTIATLNSARIDLSSLTSVRLLNSTAGSYTNLATPTQDATGLHVTLPSSSAPFSALAYVVKFTFSGAIPALQPAATAMVFKDVNNAGGSARLTLGSYTAGQLSAAGMPTQSISSLKLTTGYQLIGYSGDNFTGTAWTFTADNPDLRNTGNNDAIVSLKVQFNPATYVRITNVTDGLVLDSGGNVASGSNLKQWTWNGSTNLQWQAVELGNGYYKLVNRTNGMVADGWGATSNGSPAQQAPWNGGTNQQWLITDQGNGRYRIANRTTGLVLDGGGAVAEGSITKQWGPDSSTNLQWTFTAL